MSLLDAVKSVGPLPSHEARQQDKKRFSELLSKALAVETAQGLRDAGFPTVKPDRGGPGEKEFQGGLGPKKVDVAYSDERHGLLLAVSVKTISVPPFGKNLKNRFSDLCTEAITLHLRFPYSVVCALFAFPIEADRDNSGGTICTFRRAMQLFGTISGREQYTDPGEKFEHVAMLLYEPVSDSGPPPSARLFNAQTEEEMSEKRYFATLRSLFLYRNPHVTLAEEVECD